MRPAFIITIDTEGDNLWANSGAITTKNAGFLPRFQRLCESYGFKPTYLVNYEMALDKQFQCFGRAVLKKGTAEIGTHVHAWNSPPLGLLEWQCHPIYITELPDDIMRLKIEFMTRLLADVFGVRPVSHRGGRWGFDERVARVLVKLGYLIDCSVTPGVSWRHCKGHPRGHGGPDYVGFSVFPYFLDLENIRRSGNSALAEVPVTIRPAFPSPLQQTREIAGMRAGFVRRLVHSLIGQRCIWLRPNGRNLKDMLQLVDWALDRGLPVLEFMLHSSELMPGGSPTFRTDVEIERLHRHIDELFRYIVSKRITGMTLADYRELMTQPVTA